MRSYRKILVGGLLCGGVVAALLLAERERAPTFSRTVSGTSPSRSADGEEPGSIVRIGATPDSPNLGPAGAEQGGKMPLLEDGPPWTVRLKGTLGNLPAEAIARSRLEVRALGLEDDAAPILGWSGIGGAIDIDLTSLQLGRNRYSELQVQIDHPNCIRKIVRIRIPSSLSGDGTIPLEVSLDRAQLVKGRTISRAGSPIPGATVGGFVVAGGGIDTTPIDRVQSDANGEWTLRVLPHGAVLVAACADGWEPAGVLLPAEQSTDLDVAVAMGEGHVVAGRVLRAVGDPAIGARIELMPSESSGIELWLGGRQVFWANGIMKNGIVKAMGDERGEFRSSGLEAGEWKVRLVGMEGWSAMPDAFSSAEVTVTPPVVDVELVADAVPVTLLVSCDGRVAPGVSVEIAGVGRSGFEWFGEADSDGKVAFLARCGGEYRVRMADAVRDSSLVVSAISWAVQEVRMDFSKVRREGRFAIIVETPEGSSVKEAGVAFYPAHVGEVGPGERPHPPMTRDCDVVDGVIGIDDVAIGEYLVVVRLGDSWGGTRGYWQEGFGRVSVTSGNTSASRIACRPGGRLLVAAISGGGGYLEAKCRIEDLGGKPVSCRFVTMGQGTAEYSKDTLSASGPVMVEQALEPGEYTVRVVGKDGTEAVRTVSIVAGRTSECRVSLP